MLLEELYRCESDSGTVKRNFSIKYLKNQTAKSFLLEILPIINSKYFPPPDFFATLQHLFV